jgi:hypothetical protein
MTLKRQSLRQGIRARTTFAMSLGSARSNAMTLTIAQSATAMTVYTATVLPHDRPASGRTGSYGTGNGAIRGVVRSNYRRCVGIFLSRVRRSRVGKVSPTRPVSRRYTVMIAATSRLRLAISNHRSRPGQLHDHQRAPSSAPPTPDNTQICEGHQGESASWHTKSVTTVRSAAR